MSGAQKKATGGSSPPVAGAWSGGTESETQLEARTPRGRRQREFRGFRGRRQPPRPPAALVALRSEADDAALGALERETESFRRLLASGHRAEVRQSARDYRAGRAEGDVEKMRSAERRGEWHARRARGQAERFGRVRCCGERELVVVCGRCGDRGAPIAESCGVRRACKRCSSLYAVRSRARFGRARAWLYERARAKGLDYRWRHGGAWGEKMLTLTLPHFDRDPAPTLLGGVVEPSRWARVETTTEARVAALFAAWRTFSDRLKRWAKAHGHEGLAWVRSFEWTPGHDGLGHPHFHVWLYSPFLPRRAEHRCSSCGQYGCAPIDRWWAEALRLAGVPGVDSGADVRVKLQAFEPLSRAVVSEVLKGGMREALAMSKLRVRGYADAHAYAAGWSMTVEADGCPTSVVAALYRALEGRRLNQGSRGFFEAEEPSVCVCCGAVHMKKIEIATFAVVEHREATIERYAIRATTGPP